MSPFIYGPKSGEVKGTTDVFARVTCLIAGPCMTYKVTAVEYSQKPICGPILVVEVAGNGWKPYRQHINRMIGKPAEPSNSD
jgi:hypothetical protein